MISNIKSIPRLQHTCLWAAVQSKANKSETMWTSEAQVARINAQLRAGIVSVLPCSAKARPPTRGAAKNTSVKATKKATTKTLRIGGSMM